MPHATHQTLLGTHRLPDSHLSEPGGCNSPCLWIGHVPADSEAVEFSTGSFWPIENPQLVEALPV